MSNPEYEYWKMIAYKRREGLDGALWSDPTGYSLGVKDWLRNWHNPNSIIHTLAVPCCDDTDNCWEDIIDRCRVVDPAYANMNSRLLQLPNELLLLIADELDTGSILTLIHCCIALRAVLRPELIKRFCSVCAPWANTPLVWAGSNMTTNPPGITTEVPEDFTVLYPLPGGRDVTCMTILDVVTNSTKRDVLQADNCLSPPQVNPHEVCYGCWDRVLDCRKIFPCGRGRVLRNLTKKEYVYAYVLNSGDGVSRDGDLPHGHHPWGFGLGTLIHLRTCWSEGILENIPGFRCHGVWAGDSFDIVVEAILQEDIDGGEVWQDISAEAREEMMDMWVANGWGGENAETRPPISILSCPAARGCTTCDRWSDEGYDVPPYLRASTPPRLVPESPQCGWIDSDRDDCSVLGRDTPRRWRSRTRRTERAMGNVVARLEDAVRQIQETQKAGMLEALNVVLETMDTQRALGPHGGEQVILNRVNQAETMLQQQWEAEQARCVTDKDELVRILRREQEEMMEAFSERVVKEIETQVDRLGIRLLTAIAEQGERMDRKLCGQLTDLRREI